MSEGVIRTTRNTDIVYPLDPQWFLSELYKILPEAVLDEDNEGQVIIYTGLRMISSDGHLAPWKAGEND